MICMTFVAKEKQRGTGQRCNFLQRRALAFTDVFLARATPVLHIYTRIALESKQNPGLRWRERRPRLQSGILKWIISVLSICTSKQGIILLARCPVKVSVEEN